MKLERSAAEAYSLLEFWLEFEEFEMREWTTIFSIVESDLPGES